MQGWQFPSLPDYKVLALEEINWKYLPGIFQIVKKLQIFLKNMICTKLTDARLQRTALAPWRANITIIIPHTTTRNAGTFSSVNSDVHAWSLDTVLIYILLTYSPVSPHLQMRCSNDTTFVSNFPVDVCLHS
jgi:hypothetical protein